MAEKMNRNSPVESLESRVLMSSTMLGGIHHLPFHPVAIVVPRVGTGSSASTGVNAPAAKAEALSKTEVLVTWTGSAGNTNGYTIQRSSTGTGGWNNIGTTSAGGRSFVNSNLAPRTPYFYRVVAEGTGGTVSISNVVEVETFFK
jgi:hypothetical protein